MRSLSASVWLEEVNAGFINELKKTVRIKDANGHLVALPDNAFIIRKPEEEFKFETFPCISIYCRNFRHDILRYNPNPVVMDRDTEHNIAVLEDQAVPFNLNYQIDFWAKFQTDRDDMTRTWLLRHFRQFNLPVVDDGGIERDCNVLSVGSLMSSDLIQDDSHIFRSIANYRIWVEIDDEVRYNMPMVTDIDFTVSPS